ncbi:MAG: hypothetical protein QOJ29_4141 [Thermoleophilaceae bacterium]|nr:hypothetical protein [Thermoleophilaceae bacterium]
MSRRAEKNRAKTAAWKRATQSPATAAAAKRSKLAAANRAERAGARPLATVPVIERGSLGSLPGAHRPAPDAPLHTRDPAVGPRTAPVMLNSHPEFMQWLKAKAGAPGQARVAASSGGSGPPASRGGKDLMTNVLPKLGRLNQDLQGPPAANPIVNRASSGYRFLGYHGTSSIRASEYSQGMGSSESMVQSREGWNQYGRGLYTAHSRKMAETFGRERVDHEQAAGHDESRLHVYAAYMPNRSTESEVHLNDEMQGVRHASLASYEKSDAWKKLTRTDINTGPTQGITRPLPALTAAKFAVAKNKKMDAPGKLADAEDRGEAVTAKQTMEANALRMESLAARKRDKYNEQKKINPLAVGQAQLVLQRPINPPLKLLDGTHERLHTIDEHRPTLAKRDWKKERASQDPPTARRATSTPSTR